MSGNSCVVMSYRVTNSLGKLDQHFKKNAIFKVPYKKVEIRII